MSFWSSILGRSLMFRITLSFKPVKDLHRGFLNLSELAVQFNLIIIKIICSNPRQKDGIQKSFHSSCNTNAIWISISGTEHHFCKFQIKWLSAVAFGIIWFCINSMKQFSGKLSAVCHSLKFFEKFLHSYLTDRNNIYKCHSLLLC